MAKFFSFFCDKTDYFSFLIHYFSFKICTFAPVFRMYCGVVVYEGRYIYIRYRV